MRVLFLEKVLLLACISLFKPKEFTIPHNWGFRGELIISPLRADLSVFRIKMLHFSPELAPEEDEIRYRHPLDDYI